MGLQLSTWSEISSKIQFIPILYFAQILTVTLSRMRIRP